MKKIPCDWSHRNIHEIVDVMLNAYRANPTKTNRGRLTRSAAASFDEGFIQALQAYHGNIEAAMEFASRVLNDMSMRSSKIFKEPPR